MIDPERGGRTVCVFAPAKINLYLHVIGRRCDGYHELDSLFAFAGVGDTVSAAPARDLTLSIDGPFADGLKMETDNLALRAARGLLELAGVNQGARLTLTKRLPLASGIGGGSVDAAAALRALMMLWDVAPDPQAMADLALELGADVPICLQGRAAFASGIGEISTPCPFLPEAWLVLVNPGVAVSTPAVFKAVAGAFSKPDPFFETPRDAVELAELLARRRNDLTSLAIGLAPEIGDVLTALGSCPNLLLARMSGSGATCFGLFANKVEAIKAAAKIKAGHPHWWTAPAFLLNRAPSPTSGGF